MLSLLKNTKITKLSIDMDYAVIADNEVRVSEYSYDNSVGEYYTFPHKYKSWLKPGTIVVYYQSKKQPNERRERLSPDAHYFGVAQIDEVIQYEKRGNNYIYLATIKDYKQFPNAVPFRKSDVSHYEKDSTTAERSRWRDGVRQIDETIFNNILFDSGLQQDFGQQARTATEDNNAEFASVYREGRKLKVYSTKYERNPQIRQRVINENEDGYRCSVCEMSFEERYGEIGRGFIHVHHNKPLYTGERMSVKEDFDIVCPNCHAMLHKGHGRCLSVQELRALLEENRH